MASVLHKPSRIGISPLATKHRAPQRYLRSREKDEEKLTKSPILSMYSGDEEHEQLHDDAMVDNVTACAWGIILRRRDVSIGNSADNTL
uniref:Uncharacterized protein n=1 Tax=Angiostrongylus cantonensis TaxID=6313 RepID=A0A0K0DRT3_ANGCA